MITKRPTSRTATFVLSLAFLACSAQATRDDDPDRPSRGGSTGASTGGASTGSGGITSATGGTFIGQPTGGTPGLTGGTGGGGASGGTTAKGGTAGNGGTTAKGGTVGNGGTVTQTGGASTVGGSAGASGGGGLVIECEAAYTVSNDGFVKAPGKGGACWHGYAYTDAGAESTVAPESFKSCGASCMICAEGEVGNSDEEYAIVGFNIAQKPGMATPGTIAPTGTGLTVNFQKTGTFPLRVQIQAGSAATQRWCYTIPATSTGTVTIPYTMFNTECWEGGAGTAYAMQPLQAVLLLVPGSMAAEAATPYSACITSIQDG